MISVLGTTKHTSCSYIHTSQVCCLKIKGLEVRFEGVQRGFLTVRMWKVIPCRGAEDKNGAGTNSGKSGTRDLESESVKSRAESRGGCEKLKTAMEQCA